MARRVIALIVCMMCILSSIAMAETVAYTKSKADVYVQKNGSPKKAGSVAAGTKVTVLDVNGSWVKVEKDGKTAYMKKSSLTDKAPSATAAPTSNVTTCKDKTIYVVSEGAKVYASADTDSKVLATMSLNAKLTMTAYNDDWAQVKNGSKKGYIRRGSVSASPVSVTASPTATAKAETGVTECNMTVYVTAASATVYKSASASSKELGSVKAGTSLTMTAYNDDWAQVKNGSATGYIRRGSVSTANPNATATPVPSEEPGVTTCNKTVYVNAESATVYKSASSSSKELGSVKLGTALTMTAYNDSWAQVKHGSATGYIVRSKLSDTDPTAPTPTPTATPTVKPTEQPTGNSTATPASGKSKEMDWWNSGIQQIFSVGTVAVVTDVDTGISWKVKRSGGYNHADVQPLTAADTAAMLKACGKWSWTRRAIWVSIGGNKYAASMNCQPHGSGSITNNNFDGHHCIHFTNSRTHGSNKVCPLHQAAIKKAASRG